MSEALLRRRQGKTAFLAGLVPHLPAIATGVGAALGGFFGQQQQPARQPVTLRAGQTLRPTVSGRTLAQQRATIGAGPAARLAPPTLTPIEQLIRGAGAAAPPTVAGIAPSRSAARVGQQYYTSGGLIRTKRRAKKRRKKAVRRRRRMTKKDKLQYAMGALAGGAKVGEILALMQAV